MEFFLGLLANPFNSLVVALIFFAAAFVGRNIARSSGKSTRPLLIAGAAWILFAVWHWLDQAKTLEGAVLGLLSILVIVVAFSLWAIYRILR